VTEEDAAAQRPPRAGNDLDSQVQVGKTDSARGDIPDLSTAKEPAPMLEAHAPHNSIHTWTDFFIHIATIVIGLVIAVGLEQSVEFLHHRHQRLQLEEQMHDVLEKDTQIAGSDIDELKSFRSYLFDLQDAISARAQGQAMPAAPPADDKRSVAIPGSPGLAPYEAAQENGTIALLPAGEIRLYNRIAYQVSLMRSAMDYRFQSLQAVNSFDNRFNHSSDDFAIFEIESVPDLDKLSANELAQYQALIGTLINATDVAMERMRLVATECRAVLDGAHDENDLIKVVQSTLSAGSKLRNSRAAGK
jgi:hypothetical protein